MKFKMVVMLIVIVAINALALTPVEKKALYFMYEEEKLAKDVYFELLKTYPTLKVFNIYHAEDMHQKSVANVLKHYGLELPKNEEIGKFKDKSLQDLYNLLISKGKRSKEEALKVGIMVEVTDVDDLDKYLKVAKSDDIIALFKFLRAGSYNHYNAFSRTFTFLTGKKICDVMLKKWCKNYPFERGIGRSYKSWYWMPVMKKFGRGGHRK